MVRVVLKSGKKILFLRPFLNSCRNRTYKYRENKYGIYKVCINYYPTDNVCTYAIVVHTIEYGQYNW